MQSTIKNILNTIKEEELEDNEYYRLYIKSSFILNEINNIIELRDQNCEKIKRYNYISSYHKISKASKKLLEKYVSE